jgi:predicted nucleic acid-binding protein
LNVLLDTGGSVALACPLSYADASLVVLGRRLRITTAFSFDDDLRACGFELVPGD